MRIIAAILSLACAAFLIFHVIASFGSVTLPTIRQLGQEEIFTFVVRLGPFSLCGLQLIAFEVVLALLAAAFMVLGLYALSSRHDAV